MKTFELNIEQIEKDKALAKQMQSSNRATSQDAFNQLYKRHKSPIFYMVLRAVKNSKDTADDLTQEIFAKVFEKRDQYDFSNAFSTWLYNLAKNHIIDYKRKTKVEVLSVESLVSEYGNDGDGEVTNIAFQLEDQSADVFNGVVRNERAEAVMKALIHGVKSEEARDIITRIFLDDTSYDKVAEQMKMPLGTVKAIMFRAKKEMKEYLSVKSRDFEYGRIRTTKSKFVSEEEE